MFSCRLGSDRILSCFKRTRQVCARAAFKKIRVDPGMPMALQGFMVDYPDPASPATDLMCSFGFFPLLANYSNPQVDQLGRAAQIELNETARATEYQEMQRIVASDCPILPLKLAVDRAFYWPLPRTSPCLQ